MYGLPFFKIPDIEDFMRNVLACIVFAGVLSAVSATPIVNGSFEDGLTGYTTRLDFNGGEYLGGDLYVTTNKDGVSATDGQNFAVLEATSQLYQNYSAVKNEQLSFDWNFVSQDYLPYNDYALFSLSGAGANVSVLLSDVSQVGEGSTGWRNYTYTFQDDFNGTFSFLSANGIDNVFNSLLCVDNIKSSVNVPEPGQLSLLIVGLLSFAGIAMRRKAKL
jgi:hypothetical protein